jgi:hypothetical protein
MHTQSIDQNLNLFAFNLYIISKKGATRICGAMLTVTVGVREKRGRFWQGLRVGGRQFLAKPAPTADLINARHSMLLHYAPWATLQLELALLCSHLDLPQTQ